MLIDSAKIGKIHKFCLANSLLDSDVYMANHNGNPDMRYHIIDMVPSTSLLAPLPVTAGVTEPLFSCSLSLAPPSRSTRHANSSLELTDTRQGLQLIA